jgi:hypothetical protein
MRKHIAGFMCAGGWLLSDSNHREWLDLVVDQEASDVLLTPRSLTLPQIPVNQGAIFK